MKPLKAIFSTQGRETMLKRAQGDTTLSVGMRRILLGGLSAALMCVMLLPASALAFNFSFVGSLHTVTEVGSTVPANGDKNPYGIVTVPRSVGSLVRGELLISNFNDKENLARHLLRGRCQQLAGPAALTHGTKLGGAGS
jgi:hypothetical protein